MGDKRVAGIRAGRSCVLFDQQPADMPRTGRPSRLWSSAYYALGAGGGPVKLSAIWMDYRAGVVDGFDISGNHFENCETLWSGGALYLESVLGTITGNTFLYNTAEDLGGAINLDHYTSWSGIEVRNNWFGGNWSREGGGAIYHTSNIDAAWFENNVFIDNSSWEQGGAIYAYNAEYSFTRIANNAFVANWGFEGGHLYLYDSPVDVTANIFVFGASGAGVYAEWLDSYEPNFSYNINYGNSGGEWSGMMDDQTGLDGNISVDPMFTGLNDDGDPTNDDLHLMLGSPAIDAGPPGGVLKDPDGSRNDIGAFGGPTGAWVP
jgi:hypothetical protein